VEQMKHKFRKLHRQVSGKPQFPILNNLISFSHDDPFALLPKIEHQAMDGVPTSFLQIEWFYMKELFSGLSLVYPLLCFSGTSVCDIVGLCNELIGNSLLSFNDTILDATHSLMKQY